eukprot:scaffold2140_cov140-Isochrysis_galbana.AAC.2
MRVTPLPAKGPGRMRTKWEDVTTSSRERGWRRRPPVRMSPALRRGLLFCVSRKLASLRLRRPGCGQVGCDRRSRLRLCPLAAGRVHREGCGHRMDHDAGHTGVKGVLAGEARRLAALEVEPGSHGESRRRGCRIDCEGGPCARCRSRGGAAARRRQQPGARQLLSQQDALVHVARVLQHQQPVFQQAFARRQLAHQAAGGRRVGGVLVVPRLLGWDVHARLANI